MVNYPIATTSNGQTKAFLNVQTYVSTNENFFHNVKFIETYNLQNLQLISRYLFVLSSAHMGIWKKTQRCFPWNRSRLL